MSKFIALLLVLTSSKVSIASEGAFTLNEVKIKIPAECVIRNAEKHILTCNLAPERMDLYLGFYTNDDFYGKIIDNDRQKNVQKIGDDYFVQFIIGGDAYNFLSLQKCNIAITGDDANLLFSVMTEIKIDNEACR